MAGRSKSMSQISWMRMVRKGSSENLKPLESWAWQTCGCWLQRQMLTGSLNMSIVYWTWKKLRVYIFYNNNEYTKVLAKWKKIVGKLGFIFWRSKGTTVICNLDRPQSEFIFEFVYGSFICGTGTCDFPSSLLIKKERPTTSVFKPLLNAKKGLFYY